jgi:hypothetical protein
MAVPDGARLTHSPTDAFDAPTSAAACDLRVDDHREPIIELRRLRRLV